ncbi:MAG: hypothetical protein AAGB14_00325 [Verrucomicrobiota bacterium]
MSRLFSIAFAIRDQIETVEGLEGTVIVDRQNNLAAEFLKRMTKAKGLAVIIAMDGARNTSPEFKTYRLRGTFTVTIFTKPVLRAKDAKFADELVESVGQALHGWWPAAVPSNGGHRLRVTRAEFPPNDTYNISRLTVSEPDS